MFYLIVGILIAAIVIWWGIGVFKAFQDRANEGEWERVAIGTAGIIVFCGGMAYLLAA